MFCKGSVLVIPCHFWSLPSLESPCKTMETEHTTLICVGKWSGTVFLIIRLTNTLSSLKLEGSHNACHLLIHQACDVFRAYRASPWEVKAGEGRLPALRQFGLSGKAVKRWLQDDVTSATVKLWTFAEVVCPPDWGHVWKPPRRYPSWVKGSEWVA